MTRLLQKLLHRWNLTLCRRDHLDVLLDELRRFRHQNSLAEFGRDTPEL